MSTLSTDRYLVARAPGGLSLVQELLNTGSSGRPREQDLLESVAVAQQWIDAAGAVWTAEAGRPPFEVTVAEDDLPRLRRLRDTLYALRSEQQSAATSTAIARGSITLQLDAGGVSVSVPAGSASQRIRAAVLAECYEASIRGNLTRLKVCANPRCHVAFYDRTRNGGAVWHDSQICGNAINLRASRARRKASAQGGS